MFSAVSLTASMKVECCQKPVYAFGKKQGMQQKVKWRKLAKP
jgi:hypothetical protein